MTTSGFEAYKRLLGYARKYWGAFALGILGFIINAQTEWAGAQVVKYIIDAIQNKNQHAKDFFPVLIVLIFLLRGVGTFLGNYFMSLVARNVVYELRRQLFDKLLTLPSAYFHRHSPGHISAKLVYDVEQVTGAATEALKTIVREGTVVTCLLGYLFWTNWRLSLSLLLIAPPVSFIVRKASKRFRTLSHRIQNSMGDVSHIVNESINGYTVVKSYGGEAFERARFETASRENLRQSMKMVVTASLNTPLVQLLMAVAMSFVVYMALQPHILGNVSAGEFVAYITAAGLLSKPMRALTDVNEKIQRGIAAAQSVFEMLDVDGEQDGGDRDAGRCRGELEFRHLDFAYPGGEPVLRDINLHIPAGKTVALVGRSGSGKSTLVNLIPRFYECAPGQILVDGQPLQSYTLESLRRQIATVNQKVVLFDTSIAANIAYGALADAPAEAIESASRAAYAHEFIQKLPDGYATRVGQDGTELSGGQRQRLAIARALLKDAPILILDEATSALDNESEYFIQEALETVMKNRTTLVIAHRLSTIEKADLIVVMEKGRIVQTGTHTELLAAGGLYAQLHSRQFADDPDAVSA
ncbi:subfamily B ATP-binding cassette protein MsbA [Fluviicoccus keumensis]|uniref:Subfamily B ATP-binding cassette protein MsbA n=1 Tax=Fluviicoccus keumensis TaxID=1435465 RepID=A0A4Q7Z409_9GAMM|nr:lipid A export permease/ATP-binding protein MsbA [Fluviicoccus keumensis]RZU45027.1 subfamily B ATP-binding cassette protein MsbA [Fluviicoccus keumensis]